MSAVYGKTHGVLQSDGGEMIPMFHAKDFPPFAMREVHNAGSENEFYTIMAWHPARGFVLTNAYPGDDQ